MLPVQGQAEIIQKVRGTLDKYESRLSEINQKVCDIAIILTMDYFAQLC
jgi:hypothetical protein